MINDLILFLNHHGLVSPERIAKRVGAMREQELESLFTEYLASAQSRPLLLPARANALDIYPDSWAGHVPGRIILQLALYVDRIYIHDPLFELAHRWSNRQWDLEYILQYPSSADDRVEALRQRLLTITASLVALKPLIEQQILHCIPSRQTQPQRNPGDLYADDIYGPEGSAAEVDGGIVPGDGLPAAIKAYCDQHLKIEPAEVVNGRPALLTGRRLEPRRMVGIHFDGEANFAFRALAEITGTRPVEVGDQSDTLGFFESHISFTHPAPIDPQTFQRWTQGDRWKFARERLWRLQQDVVAASLARARFLTPLRSSVDLLSLLDAPEHTADTSDAQDTNADRRARHGPIPQHPAAELLRLELPYFDQATPKSIAEARRGEASFEEFRVALGKALEEIATQPTPEARRARAEALTREVLQAPTLRVKERMAALKKRGMMSGAILLGSLGASVFAHSEPTIATFAAAVGAGALVDLLREQRDAQAELEQVRALPGYFYWQATGKPRKP